MFRIQKCTEFKCGQNCECFKIQNRSDFRGVQGSDVFEYLDVRELYSVKDCSKYDKIRILIKYVTNFFFGARNAIVQGRTDRQKDNTRWSFVFVPCTSRSAGFGRTMISDLDYFRL